MTLTSYVRTLSDRRTRAAMLVLVLVAWALLLPALLPGRVLLTTDVSSLHPWAADATPAEQVAPHWTEDALRENLSYRVFLHNTLGRGEVPLWSPYNYGGMPFAALSHVEVFYPPSWLAAQLNPFFAHGAMAAFHLSVAGLGMLWMLRLAGLGPWPALVGALVFMFNGMFATRVGHPQFLATGCWLPWVGAGISLLSSRFFAGGAAMVALATAMTVLAGHPSVYVYGFYFMGFWLLLRLADAPDWRTRGLAVGSFVLGFGTGVALSCGQLLATLEFAQFSDRSNMTFKRLVARMPHWMHLARAVLPNGSGTPVRGDFWSLSRTSYPAGTLYAGLSPLILAIFALRQGWRQLAIFGLGLLTLAVMFVPQVYRLAYRLVPGFTFSRIDRVAIIWFLVISVLAAFGAEALLNGQPKRWKRLSVGWLLSGGTLVAAASVGLAVLAASHAPPEAHRELWWAVGLALLALAASSGWSVWAGLRPASRWLGPALCALLIVELGSFAAHNISTRASNRVVRITPAIAFLQQAEGPARITRIGGRRTAEDWSIFPANIPLIYGIEDLNGFGPLHSRKLERLLAATEAHRAKSRPWRVMPALTPEALASPIYDLLGARYVLTEEPVAVQGLELVHQGDVFIYENTDVLPRAWFVDQQLIDPDLDRTARMLHNGGIDPRTTVVLERRPAHEGEGTAVAGANTVALAERGLNDVSLDKQGPNAGWVVLSEAYYPGWQATVDGVSAEVIPADAVLRAVWVEAGAHHIVFRYRPTYWRVALAGIVVGGSTLLLLLGLALFMRPRAAADGL